MKMDILHVVLKCIGAVIMAIAVICVYDARKLTKKFFGTSDVNSATKTLKIVGTLIFLIGAAIVIWC